MLPILLPPLPFIAQDFCKYHQAVTEHEMSFKYYVHKTHIVVYTSLCLTCADERNAIHREWRSKTAQWKKVVYYDDAYSLEN